MSSVMHSGSHWRGIGATIEIQPSRHWYIAMGWNDSPNRLPHRVFTQPVWVYIVIDH